MLRINKKYNSIKLDNKTGLKKGKEDRRDLTFFKFQEENLTSSEIRESAGDSADGGQRPRLLNEIICRCGGMADATDSKSVVREDVWVQVPPSAPSWRGTLSL